MRTCDNLICAWNHHSNCEHPEPSNCHVRIGQSNNNEEFEESKEEVIMIIDNILGIIEKNVEDNKYCLENGSTWSYEQIRKFLKKHLKR